MIATATTAKPACGMFRFALTRPDFATRDTVTLGETWRDLETRADPSPFQLWSWVGCLAGERYTDPVLLCVTLAEQVVALALCNRRALPMAPDALHLGATGHAALDGVFVEHNGPLIAREHAAALAGPCLRALLTLPLRGLGRRRTAVIGGGDAGLLQAARAERRLAAAVAQIRSAPWVDLAALGSGGLLDRVSSGTRYQLRRSLRLYTDRGPPRVRRAESVPEALAFLDALAAWHQQTWRARGQPGAFADAAFTRFHRALVASGVPRGEVDLLSVAFGDDVVGYLYNLRAGSSICNYQSGFNYDNQDKHCKPGMTSHHLAIERYHRGGFARYDFLAGDDLYKKRLATAAEPLYWAEVYRPWSGRHAVLAARQLARAARDGLRRVAQSASRRLVTPMRFYRQIHGNMTGD